MNADVNYYERNKRIGAAIAQTGNRLQIRGARSAAVSLPRKSKISMSSKLKLRRDLDFDDEMHATQKRSTE